MNQQKSPPLPAASGRPALPPAAPTKSVAPVAAPTQAAPGSSYAIRTGKQVAAQRVLLYGPGGVGKSTLASQAPKDVLFIDLERGSNELDVARISSELTFAEVRSILQNQELLLPFTTIVIDSGTALEKLAIADVLANVPHEKGHKVNLLEGYGFGKGYQFVFERFSLVLADLDRLIEKGKNVIMVCHDTTQMVPNPAGDDFQRWEPDLQNKGNGPIRNRTVQWADHVLFVGYDVIAKDGKGKGGGTRTIWTQERPDHIAKTRRALEARLDFENANDARIWSLVFGGGA